MQNCDDEASFLKQLKYFGKKGNLVSNFPLFFLIFLWSCLAVQCATVQVSQVWMCDIVLMCVAEHNS